jgi:hypothetical protein
MPRSVPVASAYCATITTRLRPTRNLHTGISGNNTNFDVKKTEVLMTMCVLNTMAWLWRRVLLSVYTNITEKHAVTLFRATLPTNLPTPSGIPSRWTQHVTRKRWYLPIRLYSMTTQNIARRFSFLLLISAHLLVSYDLYKNICSIKRWVVKLWAHRRRSGAAGSGG